jgi:hypothetical protein
MLAAQVASQDSSFNARGQTVVAFQTLDTGPRAFGVGVTGSRCGVHGEGMTTPLGATASVSGVGVHGRGDFYGVYGIAGTIKRDEAPDLSSTPPHPIGVIGVSESTPAVLGDNGVLKSDLKGNLGNDMILTIAETSAGVVGVSKDGAGVIGVAGLATASGHEAFGHASSNISNNGLNHFNSGVTAVGAGPGSGLYAVASGGRAAIFESLPSAALRGQVTAQVHLKPLQVGLSGTEISVVKTLLVSLPRLGQMGDLISVVLAGIPGVTQAPSLWFCVQSGTADSPAHWAEILFGRGVVGSA